MKLKYLIPLVAALLCGFATGCTTGANNIAVKSEAALIPSVNIGMSAWADRVNSGKATQAQVDTVKTAYEAYYTAQIAAKAALERSIASNTPADEASATIAQNSMKEAQVALINLLNQYLK